MLYGEQAVYGRQVVYGGQVVYSGPLFIWQWTMKQRVVRTRGRADNLSRINPWDLILPTRPHVLKTIMSPTIALVAGKQIFK